MRPVILYRLKEFEKEELEAAKNAGFFCTKYFTDLKKDDFIFCRYSLLGGGIELEHDINAIGAKLINSWKQFRFIADLQNWYEAINEDEELTPKTWFNLDEIPDNCQFVLKGETTSKKFYFDTHMYAKNKQEAIQVYLKLCDDGWIGQQSIVIRKFIPLKTFLISEHKLPISNEYRIFVLNGKIMGKSYYWANFEEELIEQGHNISTDQIPIDFVQKIIDKIGNSVNGFVMDVAETNEGNWILVELNALEQSGLSLINPKEMYINIYKELNNQ